MAAPSWVGPTVMARCDHCGHVQEIPDPDVTDRWTDDGKVAPGGCEGCAGGEGSQLTTKTVVDDAETEGG